MRTVDPVPTSPPTAGSDYEADFFAWTQRTAALLRERRFEEVDVEYVAEEVEDMGRRERRELIRRIVVLLSHLLKWQLQPDQRSRSWKTTIVVQRAEIEELLADNPSFRVEVAKQLSRRWTAAVERAAAETGLDTVELPASCPWSAEQVLNGRFYPA